MVLAPTAVPPELVQPWFQLNYVMLKDEHVPVTMFRSATHAMQTLTCPPLFNCRLLVVSFPSWCRSWISRCNG